jgi:GDP-4-dehydro-6-deoxy-D-mannose reductase
MADGPLLILGSSGFAGGHLTAAAEAEGVEIVRAARSGDRDLEFDLLDPGSIERAVESAAPAAVINLAGFASVGQSWGDPAAAFEANLVGAVNVLEAVARRAPAAHVVCVSSGEVYGEIPEEDLPAREEHPLRPLNPYGASKAALEIACAQYERAHGLRIAVIRAFNQLGPGQSERFAASSFARQIAAAERSGARAVTLATGNTEVARDFVDVRDVAHAYLLVIERDLVGTFNACSEEAMKISELIDALSEAARVDVEREVDPAKLRRAEPAVVFGSAERLRDTSGWRPRTPIARSLADLLEWWRERLVSR